MRWRTGTTRCTISAQTHSGATNRRYFSNGRRPLAGSGWSVRSRTSRQPTPGSHSGVPLYRRYSPSGLDFYAKIVAKHLNEELPIAGTENVIRDATRAHQGRGAPNKFIDRIKDNALFKSINADTGTLCDAGKAVGCVPERADELVSEEVSP
eukprot:IDg4323t1